MMSKVRIASAGELEHPGCKVYQANGHVLALFRTEEGLFAVDNRCPHMGFPLDQGSVKDGILTCHWHHARFDLATGGAFDLFADDVEAYPVTVEGDDVFVDLSPTRDPVAYSKKRLQDGLEQNLRLVVAKAVINLIDPADPATANAPFRIGLEFGSRYRRNGWAMGQTINTCMRNLIPDLAPADRPIALYQGLTAVARDTDGMPPHFHIDPLPGPTADIPTLKRWFQQFVEVRDNEGAERCLASAIQAGADDRQVADMLFAAVTDHRYLTTGHVADFTNKALEALDQVGWDQAATVLPSLVPNYIFSTRMEERNEWRHPIDLAAILDDAFEKIPAALEAGQGKTAANHTLSGSVSTLLSDDPQAIVDLLLDMLADGVSKIGLAQMVSYAAARRMAHFHTANEFGDWDTVLHTFTYANAIEHGLRRVDSVELLRGVFDAAMSVYLDRFLNVPSAPLPRVEPTAAKPADLLADFSALLNERYQVNQAGRLVAQYLANGGEPAGLMATLGHALLREDPDFHTIQTIETAFRQVHLLAGQPEAAHVL
ncbi:MAG: Rieske (2Fe-2S) protein, partial [Anaerolineae bacterium]|nr:Rieske (2Fe-2S) protein [Anaerolineae bacterium]